MSGEGQPVAVDPRDATENGRAKGVVAWRLKEFQSTTYDKGRPRWLQGLWFATLNLLFMKWWLPAQIRVLLLKLFGAEVGDGVYIKHGVKILWPWKLSVGSNTWLGEDVWLLNLEPISIGSDVCISQGAFLCTGSHRWDSPAFAYDNGPISVGNGSWLAAQCLILRGVAIGASCVVGARVVVSADVPAGTILTNANDC